MEMQEDRERERQRETETEKERGVTELAIDKSFYGLVPGNNLNNSTLPDHNALSNVIDSLTYHALAT